MLHWHRQRMEQSLRFISCSCIRNNHNPPGFNFQVPMQTHAIWCKWRTLAPPAGGAEPIQTHLGGAEPAVRTLLLQSQPHTPHTLQPKFQSPHADPSRR
jgi:hypothetical protein